MKNPAQDFSFIRLQIFLKGVWRFSTKWIKCKYLHKINEKYRAGINGCFYIKNPLLWEWHFHKLLCEEMIFLLPSGKNDGLRYIISSHKSGNASCTLYMVEEPINFSITFLPQSNIGTDIYAAYPGATLYGISTCIKYLT